MSSGSKVRVVLLSRYPGLDRVPSLRSLLVYFSEAGHEIDIVCPPEKLGSKPSFLNERMRVSEVDSFIEVAGRRLRFPSSVKLLLKGISLVRRNRGCVVLGTHTMGNVVAAVLTKVYARPFVAYVLEYPARRGDRRGVFGRLEHWALRSADLVVTHDEYHANFLQEQVGVRRERIALLPNGTLGPAGRLQSNWLQAAFGFAQEDVVVIHSGGLGPWFESIELAKAARTWPERWRLVFHTSRRIPPSQYAEEFRTHVDGTNVFVHAEPVPCTELDALVSSAHIGVALYSLEVLGYRAELMGLAAGKVGQYFKNGLPVVATGVPTIREYVERYGCGVCVDRAEQVKDAVARILADYETYSANAVTCFKELWAPEKHCAVIAERVSQLHRSAT